jgi:ATP-dependent Lon protease
MITINEHNEAILILKGATIIPHTVTPIILGKTSSIESLEIALEKQEGIGVFLQKNSDSEIVDINDIYPYGTYVKIINIAKNTKGNMKILLEGIHRIKLEKITKENNIFFGNYSKHTTITHLKTEIEWELLWKQFVTYYQKYQEYNKKISSVCTPNSNAIDDIEAAIDIASGSILLNCQDRQKYLAIANLEDRIYALINFINKEITIIEVEKKIKLNLQNQLETTQKEYYLKEQLKAIQKELKVDKQNDDILDSKDTMKKKAQEIGMPDAIYQKIEKEYNRLEQMQELSTEASILKNYIDCLLSLPWQKKSLDTISLQEAKRILDHYHYGLKKVKERIIEFIAALKYVGDSIKPLIICLVGPPGVGKTSLAESIALSLNREFCRIALGGIRDEADIRGHRKTYVAAMPGKIIQAFKKTTTVNPVFLLDEIDKMAHDMHGDPSSALLEVLDPKQNKEFVDSFLEVPYDLSQTIFITTANHLDNIPYPLLDRLEIVSLSGYTLEEKINIAKLFILPKILKEHHLDNKIIIDVDILQFIISEYTKEAGVRQLERIIVRLIRKVIAKEFLLEKNKEKVFTFTKNIILDYLKNPLFKINAIPHKDKIGIVSGLAWTEVGGDILEIEVAITPGKGNIQLTGQLGEVMQESAQTALTYLKTKMKELKITKKKLNESDIHIHVPEGATPKDGPSAGIAMCTALISALTGRPVNKKIAMTGEITLQGRILPIGGLKEKILAAELQEYNLVILPEENKELMEEIISEIGTLKLEIMYFNHMDQVINVALKKNISKTKK